MTRAARRIAHPPNYHHPIEPCWRPKEQPLVAATAIHEGGMIGILCATAEELAALNARLELNARARAHGPTRVWSGRFRGEALVLAQAGIGKVNAAAAATLLLGALGARTLVFCGVAGGLDPELPVGALLLADRLA